MAEHNIGFSRWLERLGFRSGRAPELVQALQPVQTAQDATRIVSPLEWNRGTFYIDDPGGTPTPQWVFGRIRSTRPFFLYQQKVQHRATGTAPAAPWTIMVGVFTRSPTSDPLVNVPLDHNEVQQATTIAFERSGWPRPDVSDPGARLAAITGEGDLSTVWSPLLDGGPWRIVLPTGGLDAFYDVPDLYCPPGREVWLVTFGVGVGFDWTGRIVEHPNAGRE